MWCHCVSIGMSKHFAMALNLNLCMIQCLWTGWGILVSSIPTMLTLRDMVDVCTWSWVLITIILWGACSMKPVLAARALSATNTIYSNVYIGSVVDNSTGRHSKLFSIVQHSQGRQHWLDILEIPLAFLWQHAVVVGHCSISCVHLHCLRHGSNTSSPTSKYCMGYGTMLDIGDDVLCIQCKISVQHRCDFDSHCSQIGPCRTHCWIDLDFIFLFVVGSILTECPTTEWYQ